MKGEFKKRLRNKSYSPGRLDPHIILEYDVREIIDEARKDFPFWGAYRAMPKVKYPSGEAIDNEAEYRKDVNKWKEKWFGNE